MYKPRSRKPANKKRSYRKSPRRTSSKKSSLVKTIKKVIHQQAENKVISTYSANLDIKYAGSVTNPTYINLTPQPITGTSVQQRIGNQIRIVKARINGFVNVKPYDAVFNPQPAPVMIKMWLCRRVQDNVAVNLPSTTDFANFFQSGATSVGFQSNMLDMTLRNNTEYWRILSAKTVTLQNTYYAGSTAPTTAILGQAYKVSAPFSFSFEKHLGLCKFNDNTTFPQNKELFLVFQNVYADGSSTLTGLISSEVHYNVEWVFEDA